VPQGAPAGMLQAKMVKARMATIKAMKPYLK
jgi:hypothetical protein